MADINNFRQLDFQESGEPADNDRVLIVEIDNDKVVGAKNYALAKLKGYISADALAYLEECRLINASVSEKEERVSNIASQSAELLESTRGETIESLEQTVTSTEPGGVNVFTITQKNGSQKSLQTRNGLRGPEGPQGPQGPAVPLVQTTGTSTTSAMSQNAVSEQLNQLKSDLVSKTSMLSYEEIMASTPPLDLDVAIPKASALKDTLIVPNYSDSNSIRITELTTEGGVWTAPSNGVLRIFGVKDNDGLMSEITIQINNSRNNDIRYKTGETSIFYGTQYIPLKKGDILVTLKYINIYSTGTPIFFPSI